MNSYFGSLITYFGSSLSNTLSTFTPAYDKNRGEALRVPADLQSAQHPPPPHKTTRDMIELLTDKLPYSEWMEQLNQWEYLWIAEVIGVFLLLILTGIALRTYFRMREAKRKLDEYKKRRERKDPFDYLTKKEGSPNHDFTGSPNHN